MAKLITPEQLARSGSEDGEQAALFAWAALNIKKYPQLKWMHAIPNGGSRHIAEAVKMVATGVRKGVFDIFLPFPIKHSFNIATVYHGLYIELKKRGRQNENNGGLSKEQLDFMQYAYITGYCVKVCYGWEEAREAILEYLKCG